MSGEVLALVVEDPRGGHLVVDSRSGWPVWWLGDLLDANRVAVYLNSTYAIGHPCPARDSLIHEVLCMRMGGEPPLALERLLKLGWLDERCPAVGPAQYPSEGTA